MREVFTYYAQQRPEFEEVKTVAEATFDEYTKDWCVALDRAYRQRHAKLPAEKQWMVEVALTLYRAWQQSEVGDAQLTRSARVSLDDLMTLEDPSRLESPRGVMAGVRLAESALLSLTPRDRTFVTGRLTQRWSEIVEGYRSEIVEKTAEEEAAQRNQRKRIDDRSLLLSAHVRAIREAEGHAQETLADLTEVPVGRIERIEVGRASFDTYDDIEPIKRILAIWHLPKPIAKDVNSLVKEVKSELEQVFLADCRAAQLSVPAADAALRLHRALMDDADKREQAIATCLTIGIDDERNVRQKAMRAGRVRSLPYRLLVKLADFYGLNPSDHTHYRKFAQRTNTDPEQNKRRSWGAEAKRPRLGEQEVADFFSMLVPRVAVSSIEDIQRRSAIEALRRGDIGKVEPAVCGAILRDYGATEREFVLVEAAYTVNPQWSAVAASLGRATQAGDDPTWQEYIASLESCLQQCVEKGVTKEVIESWLERPPGSLEVMLTGGATRMLLTVEALNEYDGGEFAPDSARLVARQRLEDWAATTKEWPTIAQRRLSRKPLTMNSQPLFPLEQLWVYDPRIIPPEVMLPEVAENYSAQFASVHSGLPVNGDAAKGFVGKQGNLAASGSLARSVDVIVSEFSLRNIEDPRLRAAQARWLLGAIRRGVDVLVLPTPQEKKWPYPCRVAKLELAPGEVPIHQITHFTVDLHGNEKSWLPPELPFQKAANYLKLAQRVCLPQRETLALLRRVAGVPPVRGGVVPPHSHRELGITRGASSRNTRHKL